MYTIINSEFMGFQGDLSIQRVDLIVDTESDIPQPKPHWSVGSMVLIADSQGIKILNNKREWV